MQRPEFFRAHQTSRHKVDVKLAHARIIRQQSIAKETTDKRQKRRGKRERRTYFSPPFLW